MNSSNELDLTDVMVSTVDSALTKLEAQKQKFTQGLIEVCKNERINKYRNEFEATIGKVTGFTVKGNKITFYADSWRSKTRKSNSYTFCK